MDAGTPLVGFWQPIDATKGGAAVSVRTALGWDAAWTNATYDLAQSGVATVRAYTAGALVQTIVGTWFTDAGAGNMKLSGVTYTIDSSGNFEKTATLTLSHGGNTYVIRMVSLEGLADHNPALVRTWRAQEVQVDGVVVPLNTFFALGAAGHDALLQLFADGTATGRELAEDDVVARGTGTWVSGGLAAQSAVPKPFAWAGRSIFQPGGLLVISTFNTMTGKSVKITLGGWAPGGGHDLNLVGVWKATAVTKDGAAAGLGEVFDMAPGASDVLLEYWADGSTEQRQVAGTTLKKATFGWWSTNGIQLITDDSAPDPAFTINYAIVGSTLTGSWERDGHDFTMTLVKQ